MKEQERIINIGSNVVRRRKEMGIHQYEIASKLGVSQSYMSKIETGKINCSLPMLVDLCDILNATPDYFLLGNMHVSKLDRNITDSLRECDDSDLRIIRKIIEVIIEDKRNCTD